MAQLDLHPRRVVIGANAHADLSRAILAARPDLETRGAKYTEISADDLEWGDTYVGFRRPPLPSMGKIRWVHCTGAGVDSWLMPVELPREILLTRTSESFGPPNMLRKLAADIVLPRPPGSQWPSPPTSCALART